MVLVDVLLVRGWFLRIVLCDVFKFIFKVRG